MTVSDVKQLMPETDVYELRDDRRYLIIANLQKVHKEAFERHMLKELPVGSSILCVVGDPRESIAVAEKTS